jgi:hypothetical protein
MILSSESGRRAVEADVNSSPVPLGTSFVVASCTDPVLRQRGEVWWPSWREPDRGFSGAVAGNWPVCRLWRNGATTIVPASQIVPSG